MDKIFIITTIDNQKHTFDSFDDDTKFQLYLRSSKTGQTIPSYELQILTNTDQFLEFLVSILTTSIQTIQDIFSIECYDYINNKVIKINQNQLAGFSTVKTTDQDSSHQIACSLILQRDDEGKIPNIEDI